MKRFSAAFLGVLFVTALSSGYYFAEEQKEAKTEGKKTAKPPSTTHKESGLIIKIDTEKRTFVMELETEKDGTKIKTKQTYIWHDVKDKFFKDLKEGDRIELLWYTRTKETIIAASCKKTEDKKEEKLPQGKTENTNSIK